jgi:hypothetical protein
MIAHRLGTLANCDVRLELEDGRMISFERRIPADEALYRSKEIS